MYYVRKSVIDDTEVFLAKAAHGLGVCSGSCRFLFADILVTFGNVNCGSSQLVS